MMRNEVEIAYATLRDIIFSYPVLSELPRIVFEHDVEAIRAGPFPCVGVRRVSMPLQKMLDKNQEYARTEQDGKQYVWYETGRYTLTCTVALFMNDAEMDGGLTINPMPFLREWDLHISKKIQRHVRFQTVDDPVPGEAVQIKSIGQPFEQHGKRLYSVKNTVQIKGKLLEADELLPPISGGNGGNDWIIHQDPSVFRPKAPYL